MVEKMRRQRRAPMRRSDGDQLMDATQPQRSVSVKTLDLREGARNIASHAVGHDIDLDCRHSYMVGIGASLELIDESCQLLQHHGSVVGEAQRVGLSGLET